MQVDPRAAASVYVAAPGGDLALDPGREVVARVVASHGDGAAKISLAGQVVDVLTDAALRVGDEIRLSVTRADATGVRLAIVTPESAGTGNGVAPGSSGVGASIVQELAKAGVPVTPQIALAVQGVADQLGGGSAATRAVANLVGRDLALSPAAAGRVAAAIDLAGSLGPSLASLASRSADVAAALPAGPPSAAALRSLLAPGLSNSELAVARIVQSAQASAPGGPITLPTPPSSSVAVIQNYVSSQVAVTGALDQLAAQNTTLGTSELLAARGGTTTSTPATGGLTPAALQAAIRGQGAAADAEPQGAVRSAAVPTPSVATPAAGAATTTAAALATSGSARANATASAATGAAAATPTPTNVPAARAVADLANLAVRFMPAVAPATGGMAGATQVAARGMSAIDIAQQAGPGGSAGIASASVAGSGAGGDPAPLVHALREFLGSSGAAGDSSKLLRTLVGTDPATLTSAIRTLPESQALQLAGKLLDLLPDGTRLAGPALQDLRHGVHAALDQLGRGLLPPGGDDLSALRSALEHVAANDPRPSVANDAARLLAAADGQQILSRSSAGADPGYVYFQVPLPDGRGAEVLVRREPGRRQIAFDEFRVAFLLDTERLGTLMIELDAHPAGIRADVRTDVPELEPYLRERTEALVEPLGREARRPVTVTTGVFEQDPPASLLEPQLGVLEPGVNEFYA